ncbi:MAG: lysophospholipid acyltransferase family protein [Gammaproteobacteria bacterium]|nr:lysophospholipid acyltransferase family protein [Gammaproteobacteria bacterium]
MSSVNRVNPGGHGEPRFQLQFLKPRFWGTWCYLLWLRLSLHLPRRWVMATGGWLGDHLRRRNAKRRRIAEINLALCFPELSERERRQLLAEHFRQYARGLIDMALVLWAGPARIDRWCELKRRDWLRQLVNRHRVIVVAYHQTTLDISGSILAGVHPSVSMMKRDRNPLVTWQLWKGRVHLDKANIRVLMRDQGLRPLVRLLRAGRLCFFIPDEDFGLSRHSVFAPFFGVQTATLTVVSRLARLTGALVLPSATRLDPQTGRYVMTVGDPLENFPGPDPRADAAALNRAMEDLIRRAPEQYMWTFRWFKTQSGGRPSPYKEAPSGGPGR